ncbi:MAG: histidine phosphatase family protein [Planctomycetes bacterium]|nr:histidine phosphatase family protein [Planctomycetota bacterium]
MSEAGRKRAEALRHVLEKAGVTAIYATQYQRTQQTVGPLAKSLKIPVIKMDAAGTEKLVARIRQKHGGETVLVVGHSNTVPEIMRAFGVAQPPVLADGDFDDLFVVTVSKSGPSRLLHLKYGKDD